MNEIATALASIKTAIDLAKILKDSSTTLAEAEQKLKLAEIISALADVKMEMAEVQTLLVEKDTEISGLKQSLEIKESLVYDPPYYWVEGEGEKTGPFCQQCYDSNGKLIRLQSWTTGYWKCKTCNNDYKDKNYSPPVRQPRVRKLY